MEPSLRLYDYTNCSGEYIDIGDTMGSRDCYCENNYCQKQEFIHNSCMEYYDYYENINDTNWTNIDFNNTNYNYYFNETDIEFTNDDTRTTTTNNYQSPSTTDGPSINSSSDYNTNRNNDTKSTMYNDDISTSYYYQTLLNTNANTNESTNTIDTRNQSVTVENEESSGSMKSLYQYTNMWFVVPLFLVIF